MVVFLGMLLVVTPTVHAVDIEFIADQQIAGLQAEFSRLPVPSNNTIEQALLGRSWLCELYGVRSRLQVERNVSLYQFSRAKNALANRGSYPIENYRMDHRGITGRTSNLEDIVRVSVDGKSLMSELSVPAEVTPGPSSTGVTRSALSPLRQVIAYAICK
jgi:hypothetical protein